MPPRRTQPVNPVLPYDFLVLAGGFPGGLNTEDAPYDLAADETPDGYGYSIDLRGRLAKSTTMPSGDTRVQKEVTVTAGFPDWVAGTAYTFGDVRINGSKPYYCLVAHTAGTFATDLAADKWVQLNANGSGNSIFYWHYQRLWSFEAEDLFYGARFYDDRYVPQGLGRIMFDEDTNDIVGIVPFGQDELFVAKSSGGYAIGNLNDTRMFYSRTPLIQEMQCAAANRLTELDGVVFVSNADGLIAYAGGRTQQLTRKVRNQITTLSFNNLAITPDYHLKRIIAGSGGTGYVYDMETGKIFRWSSTNFRYTTRQWHLPDWEPFECSRLLFVIEHNTVADGFLKYQFKIEDNDWSQEKELQLRSTNEKYTVDQAVLDPRPQGRRLQVRLTDLSTNKYIKEIRMDLGQHNFGNYSQ